MPAALLMQAETDLSMVLSGEEDFDFQSSQASDESQQLREYDAIRNIIQVCSAV